MVDFCICRVYTNGADVYFAYRGLVFVWDGLKAQENVRKHGVRFERAAEVFFDPSGVDEDASVADESRLGLVGRTLDDRTLYVVHMQREGLGIRLISAREATKKEIRLYEDGG